MKSLNETNISIIGIPNGIHSFDEFLSLPLAKFIIATLVSEPDDEEDNFNEFLIAYQVSEIRIHLDLAGFDCKKLSEEQRQSISDFSVDYISENYADILSSISPASFEKFNNMVKARRRELGAQLV